MDKVTMIQTFVVLAIVAAALVYVLRRVFTTICGKGSDCGCGCGKDCKCRNKSVKKD